MGIGKTAVSRCLQDHLPDAVFLDGDWCWDAKPFRVTDETVAMVLDNISHVLNNFLRSSAYQNVIFCWVLHRQTISDAILGSLSLDGYAVTRVNLISDEAALVARLRADIDAGRRAPDVIERSLERLPLYATQQIPTLDTTRLSIEQAALAILEMRNET